MLLSRVSATANIIIMRGSLNMFDSDSSGCRICVKGQLLNHSRGGWHSHGWFAMYLNLERNETATKPLDETEATLSTTHFCNVDLFSLMPLAFLLRVEMKVGGTNEEESVSPDPGIRFVCETSIC